MSFDLGSAIGGALQGWSVGGFYGAGAGFFIGGFAGGDAKRSARNKARDRLNAQARDRDIMVQGSVEPWKLVYGRAKVSGPILYAENAGSKGEFLHLVVGLTGHEVDAIETVYLNEAALTLDGAGNVTNSEFARVTKVTQQDSLTVSGGLTVTLTSTPTVVYSVDTVANAEGELVGVPFTWSSGTTVTLTSGVGPGSIVKVSYEAVTATTPLINVQRHLGSPSQTADTALIAASAGKWTSADKLQGRAYLYIKLEFDTDIFGALGLPNFSAVVRGYKVPDPRTGTTVWSENSALCAAHFLKTWCAVPTGDVLDAELITEANACDELVTLTAGGATEKRYTCNVDLVLDESTSRRQHMEAILETMAGSVAWAQGRYVVRAGRHLAAEFTLDESYLAGQIQVQPEGDRSQTINRVTPLYVEPAKAWAMVQAKDVTNAAYVTEDAGEDLPLELALDGVTGSMRAQRLAKIELERNRAALRASLVCNLRAYDVLPGSTVAVTLAVMGWSGKLFTVKQRAHDLMAHTVTLQLRETASTVWDWAFGEATAFDATPNTTLPNPLLPPDTLTGLAVTSGTTTLQVMGDGSIVARAKLTWTQSTDAEVVRGGKIDVQWYSIAVGAWVDDAPVPGDATSTYVAGLPEGPSIFRVRARNVLGRVGAWASVTHTVVGKSQPPSNVEGLRAAVDTGKIILEWDMPPDADWMGDTELRLGSGAWSSAAGLWRGNGLRYDWAWPAPGTYTLQAKFYDTSRNESTTAATLPITVNADGTIQAGSPWVTSAGVYAEWTTSASVLAPWTSGAQDPRAQTIDIAPQAATEAASKVSGDPYPVTFTAHRVVDPMVYTATATCELEVVVLCDITGAGGASFDAGGGFVAALVDLLSDATQDTSGIFGAGTYYTYGGAVQVGGAQLLNTSREAYTLKAFFPVVEGQVYLVGLLAAGKVIFPSPVYSVQVHRVEVHITEIKR